MEWDEDNEKKGGMQRATCITQIYASLLPQKTNIAVRLGVDQT